MVSLDLHHRRGRGWVRGSVLGAGSVDRLSALRTLVASDGGARSVVELEGPDDGGVQTVWLGPAAVVRIAGGRSGTWRHTGADNPVLVAAYWPADRPAPTALRPLHWAAG